MTQGPIETSWLEPGNHDFAAGATNMDDVNYWRAPYGSGYGVGQGAELTSSTVRRARTIFIVLWLLGIVMIAVGITLRIHDII